MWIEYFNVILWTWLSMSSEARVQEPAIHHLQVNIKRHLCCHFIKATTVFSWHRAPCCINMTLAEKISSGTEVCSSPECSRQNAALRREVEKHPGTCRGSFLILLGAPLEAKLAISLLHIGSSYAVNYQCVAVITLGYFFALLRLRWREAGSCMKSNHKAHVYLFTRFIARDETFPPQMWCISYKPASDLDWVSITEIILICNKLHEGIEIKTLLISLQWQRTPKLILWEPIWLLDHYHNTCHHFVMLSH